MSEWKKYCQMITNNNITFVARATSVIKEHVPGEMQRNEEPGLHGYINFHIGRNECISAAVFPPALCLEAQKSCILICVPGVGALLLLTTIKWNEMLELGLGRWGMNAGG